MRNHQISATNMEVTGLPAVVSVAIEDLLEENELLIVGHRRRWNIDSGCCPKPALITRLCHSNAHSCVQEENALSGEKGQT